MSKSTLPVSGAVITIILAGLAIFWTVSCRGVKPLVNAGTRVAVGTGTIDQEQAASIRRGSEAVFSATEAFTPEQEHFIGRSVAASVIASYPALDRPDLNNYLNTLGQTLALYSDRPETFAGYRFLALDADELNAFATPGGFVLITRGMIRAASNEDQLAAILAHEIAHVQNGHGLRAIRGSRINSAVTILASETARHLGGRELAELTGIFEGSISDISQALIGKGYSRAYEREADRDALTILARAGYPPHALVDMLEKIRLAQQAQPTPAGWARTHPPPSERIRDARRLLRGLEHVPTPPQRAARFNVVTAGL